VLDFTDARPDCVVDSLGFGFGKRLDYLGLGVGILPKRAPLGEFG
jgi:hypothetical protein